MKLGIMQPYLFPYVGYFQLMHAVDRFVVYDDVTFIKQGWINRNRLLVNGAPSFFGAPLKSASSFTSIRDTLIDDGPQNRKWVGKIQKTFDAAYRRAPHFLAVFPLIERVFTTPTDKVRDLAVASLRAVAEYLDIQVSWVETSSAYGNGDLSGEERVLDICRREGATTYLNPVGGLELYSRDHFAERGLELGFVRPKPIEYRQFREPFVPWLSIVDVMMFNDRDACRAMLTSFDVA